MGHQRSSSAVRLAEALVETSELVEGWRRWASQLRHSCGVKRAETRNETLANAHTDTSIRLDEEIQC